MYFGMTLINVLAHITENFIHILVKKIPKAFEIVTKTEIMARNIDL